jgi:hypothetical protein
MEGNNMENTKKNEEHNSRLYHEVKLARERLQNITHVSSRTHSLLIKHINDLPVFKKTFRAFRWNGDLF